MSKRPVIDRDQVLNAAESIVMTRGVAALTIGEVAKAAAITKGGVQSCFGTKDGLIEAMVTRWKNQYEMLVRSNLGADTSALGQLATQVKLISVPNPELSKRAAAIMAAMFSQESLRKESNDWYRSQMLGQDFHSESGRSARLAFLAATGAFFLRSFDIMEISESEWEDLFRDIHGLLPDDSKDQ